jgi:membrane fusion protein, multidrug efflux system
MSDSSPSRRTGSTNRRWLRHVVKGTIVLAAILIVAGLTRIPSPERDVSLSEAPPVNVVVMPVRPETQLPDTFNLPGAVEPNRIVTVAAEVAGRIERIPPREGSTVQAGDLLVQLNTDLIEPQVEIARAQHQRDRIQYDRMRALIETEATSRSELDDAVTGLARSEAQLREVQARLERARIVAPITGVLNDLPIEEGEYVQPGTAVAEIVEIDTVKVVVNIPERDVAFFSTGQRAEVLAPVKGRQQSFEGIITFISRVADLQTRSTRVEIALDNEDGSLHSGQLVLARLTRRVLKDAILIPLLAVIPMENTRAVYVVSDSKAERREVELGIIRGDRVQITKGLQPGDQLIVSGHRFVAPGQDVRVIPQASESK